jgi:hypothetical protein
MQNLLIQISHDELTKLISNAVRDAMPAEIQQATKKPFIKGIHQLATFLQVSPVRAQKLKNEGAFPYWQDGRTLLFDPDQVRDAMNKTKKAS